MNDHQRLDSFYGDLRLVTLRECDHCRLHEVELLLQVIETDVGIDSVPVRHSSLPDGGSDQLAINVLVV